MPAGVIVVGAGIGGLAAAVALAARGVPVQLFERAAAPGGKMRELVVAGRAVDAGPTVMTMRWVFDELFDEAGANLDAALHLARSRCLARHAWPDGSRLDLLDDLAASAAEVERLAGADEAARFLAFSARAARIATALERPFLRSARPDSPLALMARAGWRGLPALLGISPFATLWSELGRHFRDPRLQQLFGRYATYCGSSPFEAPATLMLVAHVERQGVWRVEGGMHRLAQALAALATRLGARLSYRAGVRELLLRGGRAAGVRLDDGRTVEAGAVVFNGDAAALGAGLLGDAATTAVPPTRPPPQRSLSAVTWAAVADTGGFPLLRHNVFFSADSAAEFAALRAQRLPPAPTVYVCAQDRGDEPAAPPGGERLLCLVNAPAGALLDDEEMARCERASFEHLARCGLRVAMPPPAMWRTTPAQWGQLFPGTGGALYGAASHGWRASFRRPGARSRIPGLYLAGGSTHPGPGVPMAALSGRLAAASVLADRASTRSWHPVAISGGMSTR